MEYKEKGKIIKENRMKDNFHIGFIVGLLTALFMAMVVSCSMEPLSAVNSSCGEESWNPCYVKIVD